MQSRVSCGKGWTRATGRKSVWRGESCSPFRSCSKFRPYLNFSRTITVNYRYFSFSSVFTSIICANIGFDESSTYSPHICVILKNAKNIWSVNLQLFPFPIWFEKGDNVILTASENLEKVLADLIKMCDVALLMGAPVTSSSNVAADLATLMSEYLNANSDAVQVLLICSVVQPLLGDIWCPLNEVRIKGGHCSFITLVHPCVVVYNRGSQPFLMGYHSGYFFSLTYHLANKSLTSLKRYYMLILATTLTDLKACI